MTEGHFSRATAFATPEVTNFTPVADIPVTEQTAIIHKMGPTDSSSPSWLNGFTITEGTGAVLGAAGGATVGYGGSYLGAGALAFVMNGLGKGQNVIPMSEVANFATSFACKGAGAGALVGLGVAGLGYLAYEGVKHGFEKT